ncbi:MAG: copper resistance CopC family protein [Actinomycetota bacterium]
MAAPAFAHGDLAQTTPAGGSTVEEVPKTVSITFTETPSRSASVLTVKDGCNDDVATGFDQEEKVVDIAIGDARPGNWTVSYRIVSAEDGHPSRGNFEFKVQGKPRCNQAEGGRRGGTNGDGEESEEAPEDSGVGAPDTGDEGGGVPWIPIGLGTVALIAVALLLRRASG